jgi:glycerol-3-phosphate dehydrogenase (NAD(P)+)
MSEARVAVIGAGSWGTALANLLAEKGVPTVLWSYEEDVAESVRSRHRNPRYLAEIELDPRLDATSEMEAAVRGASVVVSVSPSHVVRPVMSGIGAFLEREAIV